MPYPNSGTLTTDTREIAVSETWDSQSDWDAYQSASEIDISNGVVRLIEYPFPVDTIENRWPANDSDTSGTLTDTYGSDDGTINGGVTYTTDSIEGSHALSFDGQTGSYVSIPSIPVGTDMTILSPVYHTEITGEHTLYSAAEGNNEWIFEQSSDDGGYWFYDGNNSVTSTTNPNADTWYLAGFRHRAGAGEIDVVVNGTAEATLSTSLSTSATVDALGTRGEGQATTNNFAGRMDDIIVWNESLTDSELQDVAGYYGL